MRDAFSDYILYRDGIYNWIFITGHITLQTIVRKTSERCTSSIFSANRYVYYASVSLPSDSHQQRAFTIATATNMLVSTREIRARSANWPEILVTKLLLKFHVSRLFRIRLFMMLLKAPLHMYISILFFLSNQKSIIFTKISIMFFSTLTFQLL